MAWIPTAVTVPENAPLCICGRRQGLKKHRETVEQEVIPRKTREGEEVRTVRA